MLLDGSIKVHDVDGHVCVGIYIYIVFCYNAHGCIL
jgi:hypothetical protein